MKPIPPNLKYVYLDNEHLYQVIVSAHLDDTSIERLLSTFKKYRDVIGYSIDNIKGVGPTLGTHRIYLEDGPFSTIKPQWILSPNMKDVVKKEILKLIKSNVIYSIPDRKCLSPIHVVAEKGGMT